MYYYVLEAVAGNVFIKHTGSYNMLIQSTLNSGGMAWMALDGAAGTDDE